MSDLKEYLSESMLPKSKSDLEEGNRQKSFIDVATYEFARYLVDPEKALSELSKLAKSTYKEEVVDMKKLNKDSKNQFIPEAFRSMNSTLNKVVKKYS